MSSEYSSSDVEAEVESGSSLHCSNRSTLSGTSSPEENNASGSFMSKGIPGRCPNQECQKEPEKCPDNYHYDLLCELAKASGYPLNERGKGSMKVAAINHAKNYVEFFFYVREKGCLHVPNGYKLFVNEPSHSLVFETDKGEFIPICHMSSCLFRAIMFGEKFAICRFGPGDNLTFSDIMTAQYALMTLRYEVERRGLSWTANGWNRLMEVLETSKDQFHLVFGQRNITLKFETLVRDGKTTRALLCVSHQKEIDKQMRQRTYLCQKPFCGWISKKPIMFCDDSSRHTSIETKDLGT